MARFQRSIQDKPRRGALARPLDALVFLLPLLVFYEAVSLTRPERVIAFNLLRRFFELFGYTGMWAPGVAVIVILLATHAASGERWAIHWRRVGLMYVEAVLLAVPLLILNWLTPLVAVGTVNVAVPGLVERMALGIGAGIYEELVFRLVLISIILMIGVDLLGFKSLEVGTVAIAISALAFAAHHHRPIGPEPLALSPFLFRTVSGAYLALIFWYRGYGLAAGCHAAYNVALACFAVT